MAHDKLNKITKMHLSASGIGGGEDPKTQDWEAEPSDGTNPQTDDTNDTDTPAKKVKHPKERAPQPEAKAPSVGKKPKGLK